MSHSSWLHCQRLPLMPCWEQILRLWWGPARRLLSVRIVIPRDANALDAGVENHTCMIVRGCGGRTACWPGFYGADPARHSGTFSAKAAEKMQNGPRLLGRNAVYSLRYQVWSTFLSVVICSGTALYMYPSDLYTTVGACIYPTRHRQVDLPSLRNDLSSKQNCQ